MAPNQTNETPETPTQELTTALKNFPFHKRISFSENMVLRNARIKIGNTTVCDDITVRRGREIELIGCSPDGKQVHVEIHGDDRFESVDIWVDAETEIAPEFKIQYTTSYYEESPQGVEGHILAARDRLWRSFGIIPQDL